MRTLSIFSAALVFGASLAGPAMACPGHGAFGYSNRGYQRIYEMYAKQQQNKTNLAGKDLATANSQATSELLKARAKSRFLSRFNVQPGPTNAASDGGIATETSAGNASARIISSRSSGGLGETERKKTATISTLSASR